MSLGLAFKGPEGIVLAADSRVTLTAQIPGQNLVIPATFDNATKLLRVTGQDYVGAVTYGLGAIGSKTPRTAHSYIPEYETELAQGGEGRLSVQDFAQRLSDFFQKQWIAQMPGSYQGPPMIFLVGGYDEGAAYGRIYEFSVPSAPAPVERHANDFGMVWGGQREYTDRLIHGFDPRVVQVLKSSLKLSDEQTTQVEQDLKTQLQVPIPFAFLPLQDCVDLSIYLIRTTISIQD